MRIKYYASLLIFFCRQSQTVVNLYCISYVQKKLAVRVEELMSFLDRTKKFQGSDADSATNTEYLKNCVYHFMAAKEHSERRRLAPVISTILKLTAQEKKAIDSALQLSESNDLGGTIGAITSSSWGFGLFGYSSPSPQTIGSGNSVVVVSSSSSGNGSSGSGSISGGSFDGGDEDASSNGRKDGIGKNDASSSSSLELSPPVPSLKGLRRARASEPSN